MKLSCAIISNIAQTHLYYTKILNNYLAIFNVQCTRMIRGIEFNKIVINV